MTTDTLPPVRERDHVLGSGDPGLTLIEYGDFGCPYCFAAKRPVESLLERFDAMRLVWRHFPDPELHPGADLAAELSELAAEAGRFWESHSLLLAGREQFSRDGFLSVADQLELDRSQVEFALDTRSMRDRVEADVVGGKQAGIRGTPTFFVNGERLQGHWRELARLVPEALG